MYVWIASVQLWEALDIIFPPHVAISLDLQRENNKVYEMIIEGL